MLITASGKHSIAPVIRCGLDHSKKSIVFVKLYPWEKMGVLDRTQVVASSHNLNDTAAGPRGKATAPRIIVDTLASAIHLNLWRLVVALNVRWQSSAGG